MEFIKNVFKSISWQLGKIILWVIIVIALCLINEGCEVKAISITDSTSTISDSTLKYFYNIFDTSKYKYYAIASDTDYTGSYNRQRYYLCLTNEKYDYSLLNANINCDQQFTYSYNNGYSLHEISDKTLKINNSIFYNNLATINNSINIFAILFLISILLGLIFWFLIFQNIFKYRARRE